MNLPPPPRNPEYDWLMVTIAKIVGVIVLLAIIGMVMAMAKGGEEGKDAMDAFVIFGAVVGFAAIGIARGNR